MLQLLLFLVSASIKLELFSHEIIYALENNKLLNHFKVYRKSATSAQTNGRITTDGPLCTGQIYLK